MTTEVDLLNTIHEYADMGLSGLNQVIPLSSDPSFTRELQHQKSDYEAALQKSEALLEERHIPRGKEAGPVAKMMSTVMTGRKIWQIHPPPNWRRWSSREATWASRS